MKNFLIAAASLMISSAAFAQCDPTMLSSHYITCMMNQQQAQTGVMPHQSYFQQPMLERPGSAYQQPTPIYQAPVPIYQAPAPAYQQPPIQWAPVNRSSSYR